MIEGDLTAWPLRLRTWCDFIVALERDNMAEVGVIWVIDGGLDC